MNTKKRTPKSKRKENAKKVGKKTRKKDNRKIWHGNGFDVLFGLLYLMEKYDDICIPITNPNVNLLSFMIGFYCKDTIIKANTKDDFVLSIPENNLFVENIKKCSKRHRFICVPLYIGNSNCTPEAHMNTIVFDNVENKIYRFESYGQTGFSPRSLNIYTWFDIRFSEWLNENKLNYKYESFTECPNIGPQEIEEMEIEMTATTAYQDELDPAGFCGVWGIYFMDVLLQNPKLTKKEIFDKILNKLKKQPRSIRTWIRNYTKKIVKHRQQFINSINSQYDYTPRKQLWNYELQDYISKVLKKRLNK